MQDGAFAEASRMKGNTRLTLTGQLGDVMKESATAALSWVRQHGATYGLSSMAITSPATIARSVWTHSS